MRPSGAQPQDAGDDRSRVARLTAAQPSAPMAQLLDTLARAREGQPQRYRLPFEQARQQLLAEREPWLQGGPPHVSVVRTQVEGARRVEAQRVTPAGCDASRILVYLHGGGWCVGSPRTHEGIVTRLAQALHCPAWSLDYALAPEHPFPAGLLDCVAAVQALARQHPQAALVLAGDSAGANLALACAMWLRDQQRAGLAGPPVALAALLLFYGVYTDDLTDPSMQAFGDGRFGLSRFAHERYLGAYAAPAHGSAAAPGQPGRSHAFALAPPVDLAGLPPAFLLAAQLDILRDQNLRLATALRDGGGTAQWLEMPGVIHGFLAYPSALPEVEQAIDAAAGFVRRHGVRDSDAA